MNPSKKEGVKNTVSRTSIVVLMVLVIIISIIGTLSILISLPSAKDVNFPLFGPQKSRSSTTVGEISLNIEEKPVITNTQAQISLNIKPNQ